MLGNTDTDEWTDPDGTYGTTGNDVFICCYNGTDDNLYYMSSFDFGVTYNTEVAVTTVPGVTRAPAPTMAPSSMTAPSSTTAFMPIRQPSPTVQACRVAL